MSTKHYCTFTLPSAVVIPHSHKHTSKGSLPKLKDYSEIISNFHNSARIFMNLCLRKAKCVALIIAYKLLKLQLMQVRRYAKKMLQIQ